MSYVGWFLVELYYMMKRFGKRKVGKVVNALLAFVIFLFGLILLGMNIVILAIPIFLFALFILIKTAILV